MATTMTLTSTPSTTTTPAMTHCPTAWSQFNTSCFWVVEVAVDWLAAEEGCQGLHPAAHLASVSSSEENNFIYHLVEGFSSAYVWLGGSDSYSEGNWTWNDGTLFDFTFWYSYTYQPDGGPYENCLAKNGDSWYDMGCFDKHFFICKINMD